MFGGKGQNNIGHIGPIFLVAFFLLFGTEGGCTGLPEIILSSDQACQGDPVFFMVRAAEGETPRALWMDREIPMAKHGNGSWCGFLGVDLKSVPKVYVLRIWSVPSGREKRVDIRIKSRDYGERRLTLPRELVELDQQSLKRVMKEAAAMKTVLEGPPSVPKWRGPFLAPLEGEISGSFGRRNIINGLTKSPHSGVDLRAARGLPVKVMNRGRVVLCSDHFFSGLSVVVDHGGGIQSMYFHLEKILVQENESLEKGEIIGHVGSTGRSTGPHLHFGMRVNGARVDPFRLIQISKELE